MTIRSRFVATVSMKTLSDSPVLKLHVWGKERLEPVHMRAKLTNFELFLVKWKTFSL